MIASDYHHNVDFGLRKPLPDETSSHYQNLWFSAQLPGKRTFAQKKSTELEKIIRLGD